MRKFILAASTLGILTVGGVMNANAQTYVQPAPGYYSGQTVYEGRNTYAPGYPAGPGYYDGATNGRTDPTDNTMWMAPGDQAIINQERANQRSER